MMNTLISASYHFGGHRVEALDPERAAELVEELLGGRRDGRAEPEALGQRQNPLGVEAVESVDRSGETVDGLILVAHRDDLSARLLLDDRGLAGVRVLRLIEENQVGVDLRVAKLPEL